MAQKINRRGTPRNSNKELILSPGEQLLIWRKRQKWNQATAAKHFKRSLFHLKLAEYDKIDNFKYPKLDLGELAPHERCLIYRKRSGKTQEEIAPFIGIGRYWLQLQERGVVSCHRLLGYWEGGG